VAKKQNLWW